MVRRGLQLAEAGQVGAAAAHVYATMGGVCRRARAASACQMDAMRLGLAKCPGIALLSAEVLPSRMWPRPALLWCGPYTCVPTSRG